MLTLINRFNVSFTDKQYFQIWALSSAIIFISFYRWPGRRLDHIPAVGSKSQLFSFIDAFGFFFNARDLILRGCAQYGHSIFRISSFDKWIVIVNGPQLIEEFRKAPEDVLSFHDAVDADLQVDYTLGPPIRENPYHIPIIRSQLTRNLPVLFSSVHEEIASAFKDVIPANQEWVKYRALETMMPIICRASNRIFVGAPLCRDPGFMKLNIEFTITVMKTALILNLLPPFLRPLAGKFLTSVPVSIDKAIEYLQPVIEYRQQKMKEYGKNYPDKPNDILSWLMDNAEGEEASLRNLTQRILTVNFAAIHTSSMTFTHALFYLAAHPEFLQPIRKEIEEIVSREGWTHAALNQMRGVDGFIKESQRHNALGCLMMGRVARKPFMFSDGTYIPVGTRLHVASDAAHFDEANYPDPNSFDPFRFLDKTKKENKGRKVDMVSTHTDFLAFGHGRHACPGRFFAANELKLMLAHLVMTYDVKLEGEQPKSKWIATACLPDPMADVMLRKRKE